MSYGDAALLMVSFQQDPPLHVLMAMRYGYYESVRKSKEEMAMTDMRQAAALRAQAGAVKTFDQLPLAIQERLRQRAELKKKAAAKKR